MASDKMKKFIDSDSTSEVKRTAEEVNAADPDIDVDGLEKAGKKFQKEKKKDDLEEAANDAQFEQPKE